MKYLILLLLSFNALADTATFSFTPPTEREDGTPLTPQEIAGYNTYLNGTQRTGMLSSGATGFVINLPPGDHVVDVQTVDTDGRLSILATLPVRILSNPKPVTGLSVIISE